MDHFRSGEIKGLVQTGRERWPDLPDVPTMAEAGIPDAVVETSQMFVAPSATPGPIIDKLTEETQQIMQQPGVKAEMLKAGFLVQYEGPGEMRARITPKFPCGRSCSTRGNQNKIVLWSLELHLKLAKIGPAVRPKATDEVNE